MSIIGVLLSTAAVSLFILFGVGFICEHWKWIVRIAVVLVYLPITMITSAMEYVGRKI